MTYHVTHLEKANVLPDSGATPPANWETLHTFGANEALLQAIIQFSSQNVRVSFVHGGVETIQLDLLELEADYVLSGANAVNTSPIFTRCYAQPCRWMFTIPDPRGWAGGAGSLVIRAQGYGAGPARQVTRGMLFWRVF